MKPCEALRIARQTESRPSSHPCVRIYARWKVCLGEPCPRSWVANTYASYLDHRCQISLPPMDGSGQTQGRVHPQSAGSRSQRWRGRHGGGGGAIFIFLGLQGYSCPYSSTQYEKMNANAPPRSQRINPPPRSHGLGPYLCRWLSPPRAGKWYIA